MWFFAVVYVVEGIGQAKVGIVWQPLTHFLKQTQGWGPGPGQRLAGGVDPPALDHEAAVRDRVGSGAAVRLSAHAATCWSPTSRRSPAYAWVAANRGAVCADRGAGSSPPSPWPPRAPLCGALLVENGQRHRASAAFVNQQWLWFNVALMAASLLGGKLIEWLSPRGALHAAAAIAAVAPLSAAARRAAAGGRGAHPIDVASCAAPCGADRHRVPFARPWTSSPDSCSILFQPRLRHAALLPPDRPAALLAGLYRHPLGVSGRRGLDRRRHAASLVPRVETVVARAAEPQHRGGHAGDPRLPSAARGGECRGGVFPSAASPA